MGVVGSEEIPPRFSVLHQDEASFFSFSINLPGDLDRVRGGGDAGGIPGLSERVGRRVLGFWVVLGFFFVFFVFFFFFFETSSPPTMLRLLASLSSEWSVSFRLSFELVLDLFFFLVTLGLGDAELLLLLSFLRSLLS